MRYCGYVASAVVKNVGIKNRNQQIYKSIVSQYGQIQRVKIYNHIKDYILEQYTITITLCQCTNKLYAKKYIIQYNLYCRFVNHIGQCAPKNLSPIIV